MNRSEHSRSSFPPKRTCIHSGRLEDSVHSISDPMKLRERKRSGTTQTPPGKRKPIEQGDQLAVSKGASRVKRKLNVTPPGSPVTPEPLVRDDLTVARPTDGGPEWVFDPEHEPYLKLLNTDAEKEWTLVALSNQCPPAELALLPIRLGDYLLVRAERYQNGEAPYVCRLVSWESSEPGEEEIRVQWFARQHEVDRAPAVPKLADDEILETEMEDTVGLQSVIGACSILPFQESPPRALLLGKAKHNVRFRCRYHFIEEFNQCTPANSFSHEAQKRDQESDEENYVEDEVDVCEIDDEWDPREVRRKRASSGGRQITGSFQLTVEREVDMTALLGREREFSAVESFLESAVRGDETSGRTMYISGVPGTGKTATVLQVISKLNDKTTKNSLPNFEVVEINGMTLVDPSAAYTILYEAVSGKRMAPTNAARLLEKRFSRQKATDKCIVLILDEVDVLVTRKQRILYDLLEWPTRPGSKMVAVCISNTMSLSEGMLARCHSRMGLNKLTYNPYTQKQLKEILMQRVRVWQPDSTFDVQSLILCAAKVAAVSGDVRRARAILDRASEISDPGATVSCANVSDAVEDLADGCRLAAIRELGHFEKESIIALAILCCKGGLEEAVSVGMVFDTVLRGGRCKGLEVELLKEAVGNLCTLGLFNAERRPDFLSSKLYLNAEVSDICFALKDDPSVRELVRAQSQSCNL